MGCDIHTFVEWTRSSEDDSKLYWWTFTSNGGSRDYTMFGLLANVRGSGCIYPPRGLPSDMGYEAKHYFHKFVTDSPDDSGRYCSPGDAERWVAAGYSQWVDDEHRWVTDPDIHSCSWLTADEFAVVLSTYMTDHSGPHHYSPEWDVMLAAMRKFEELGCRARLVFGFDN